MTTPLVPSITDEQLIDLESQCEKFSGFAVNSTLVEQLIYRLRAAEKDSERIDFISEHIFKQCGIISRPSTNHKEVLNVWSAYGIYPESAGTFRDAIDAAMQEHNQ